MHILVGLGNPGKKYAGTRHNAGFLAIDEVVRRHGLGAARTRFSATTFEGVIAGIKLLAMKPNTFVNESGRAVGEALRFYKCDPADVTVIHDDLDLQPGKVRVKRGGGHAGHNGLRSIDAHIGANYRRVRIGIGHPGARGQVTGHVLSPISAAERGRLDEISAAIAEALPLLLTGDDPGFMSKVALRLNPPGQAETDPTKPSKPPKPPGGP